MQGAKSLLTELFDVPLSYSRETMKGKVTVKNPCISILSGTTIHWFLKNIKERDLWGGFLPRFIFVPAFKKERFMALPPPVDTSKQNAFVRYLNEIRNLKGEVTLSDEAKGHYTKWVKGFEDKIPSANLFTAFYYRLETYSIKFAMLEAIARQSLIISSNDITRAISHIDWLSKQLTALESEEFTFTPYERNRKKVLAFIKNRPAGISRADLTKSCKIRSRDLDEVIKSLLLEEQISVVTKPSSTKPITYYVFKE